MKTYKHREKGRERGNLRVLQAEICLISRRLYPLGCTAVSVALKGLVLSELEILETNNKPTKGETDP